MAEPGQREGGRWNHIKDKVPSFKASGDCFPGAFLWSPASAGRPCIVHSVLCKILLIKKLEAAR